MVNYLSSKQVLRVRLPPKTFLGLSFPCCILHSSSPAVSFTPSPPPSSAISRDYPGLGYLRFSPVISGYLRFSPPGEETAQVLPSWPCLPPLSLRGRGGSGAPGVGEGDRGAVYSRARDAALGTTQGKTPDKTQGGKPQLHPGGKPQEERGNSGGRGERGGWQTLEERGNSTLPPSPGEAKGGTQPGVVLLFPLDRAAWGKRETCGKDRKPLPLSPPPRPLPPGPSGGGALYPGWTLVASGSGV